MSPVLRVGLLLGVGGYAVVMATMISILITQLSGRQEADFMGRVVWLRLGTLAMMVGLVVAMAGLLFAWQ